MNDPEEFEPTSNWLVRAYHTPVSDALRGRLSGRLDVRRRIAAADLPAPLSSLINSVVRQTRLCRPEKLDVARELVAHFADGLAAGRSAELLVEQFGSPQQAARLIRKAKRRNRPLYWQAWWYASLGLMALIGISIVGYALLAARFYLAHPTISHNYWNDINAARTVPEDQRAWPLYRAAMIKLGEEDSKILAEHHRAHPGDKAWATLEGLLKRHPESIELARQGTAKPHLGYLLGDRADRVAAADWFLTPDAPLAEDNSYLLAVLLDSLQVARQLASLLATDALRAAAAGDGATAAADLSALLSLAEHTMPSRATIVEQSVGYAIFSLTAENTRTILAQYPSVFSDPQLRDLAHEFAGFQGGSPTVDWTVERFVFDDLLQRTYTDDGSGDGRMTENGLAVLDDLLEPTSQVRQAMHWEELLGPGVAALIGSRRENRDLFNSHLDEMIALHQDSPWQWDHDAIQAAEDRLQQAVTSSTGRIHYLLAGLMLPAIQPVFSVAQRSIQERDATELVIALVLWHRQHGQWPPELEQLVPGLLPAVPADRYVGQPLRYVVRDGQPVVYSIGYDRDDDGGRPTSGEPFVYYDGLSPEQLAKSLRHARADDGDWILWPPQRYPAAEESSE